MTAKKPPRPPLDLKEEARKLVERTRKEQGLPKHIEDPVVIAKVVALLHPRTASTPPTLPGRRERREP